MFSLFNCELRDIILFQLLNFVFRRRFEGSCVGDNFIVVILWYSNSFIHSSEILLDLPFFSEKVGSHGQVTRAPVLRPEKLLNRL